MLNSDTHLNETIEKTIKARSPIIPQISNNYDIWKQFLQFFKNKIQHLLHIGFMPITLQGPKDIVMNKIDILILVNLTS